METNKEMKEEFSITIQVKDNNGNIILNMMGLPINWKVITRLINKVIKPVVEMRKEKQPPNGREE